MTMLNIIYAVTPQTLRERVQEKLHNGWDLYGEPFVFDGMVCQYILDSDADDEYQLVIADTIEIFIRTIKQMDETGWMVWGKPVAYQDGGFILQWMQRAKRDDLSMDRSSVFNVHLVRAEGEKK